MAWNTGCLFGSSWTRSGAALLGLVGSVSVAQAGTYTTLHAFTGGADGATPFGGLTADNAKNLYGVAAVGGKICPSDTNYGCGVVFRIDPAGVFTTLHLFDGGSAGFLPENGVTLAGGQLVGSAFGGDSNNDGVLFAMAPDGSGFTITHQFTGLDGSGPQGLLADGHGGYFGTAFNGGPTVANGHKGNGMLFAARADGTYKVVHQFTGGADGRGPDFLVKDQLGNVYGSTAAGGEGPCSCGTVFEYEPHLNIFRVIYTFQDGSDGRDGILGGVNAQGVVYGAAEGGTTNHGLLFSLTPSAPSYRFTLLAGLRSTEQGDEPAAQPTLLGGSTLIGPTATYLYGYHASKIVRLAILGPSPALPVDPGGQLLVSKTAVLYSTSVQGGITPCVYPSGIVDSNGCGNVFSYDLHATPAH